MKFPISIVSLLLAGVLYACTGQQAPVTVVVPIPYPSMVAPDNATASPNETLPAVAPDNATASPNETLPALASTPSGPQLGQRITITGWFTTIWNEEPIYSITDDQGQTTQLLLLDEELAKPFGGPLAFDRKRVTIAGDVLNDPPGVVRVLSIEFETESAQQVTITGWFTTVWNDEPHYSITDDQGQRTELLLDEELAKPYGGPLAFDRKRVIIVGEVLNDPTGLVRVLSIKFADGG